MGVRVKVLACDGIDAGAIERLRQAGHQVAEAKGLKGAALITALAGVQGLIVRGATQVTAEVFPSCPDLRIVVRAGTGTDNIDSEAAAAAGVTVANTPHANSVSVAELVFAMMLALERHLVPASNDLRQGVWEKSRYQGRELSGRTLGVLGFGRIGREVATRARAFDLTVVAHDPRHRAGSEGFDWVRAVDRDEVFRVADILTVHVPLHDGTRHLVNARNLALLKADAILVNASRGGVVDESALFDALATGQLRAAAMDVFESEPPPSDHPLLKLPNFLPLPHLGASTAEAQRRAGIEAAERVIDALA